MKPDLNKVDPHINRGFELMLRKHNRGRKSSKPKTFQMHFGEMFSLLKREIHIYFEFSFNIIKK